MKGEAVISARGDGKVLEFCFFIGGENFQLLFQFLNRSGGEALCVTGGGSGKGGKT